MVFSGLSTAWRLASCPTRRSPVLVNATTDGVKRLPSLLIMTVGLPPSITATTEFVVPRSIPTAFAMIIAPLLRILEASLEFLIDFLRKPREWMLHVFLRKSLAIFSEIEATNVFQSRTKAKWHRPNNPAAASYQAQADPLAETNGAQARPRY